MKKILVCLTIISFFWSVSAQDNTSAETNDINKTELTLRPNSREYAPVHKTNMHQRMELRQSKSILRNKTALESKSQLNENVSKLNVNRSVQYRTQQEIIKRQQIRMLRRKMILQQQRKLRRR